MTAKRIGILTYHFSENFGALMQAYGLRQWLLDQGHQAEFVNYHPRYVEEGGDFENVLSPAAFRRNLKVAYLRLSTLQRKLFGSRLQAEHFEAFRRDVLGVSGPRLENEAEVEAFLASPEGRFDVLVCGSDQIWNPSPQKGLDSVYFLAMKDAAKARHVAYAPSFGKGSLDPSFDGDVRRFLSGMHGLSVREESGVEIVRRITGRHTVCVPDPTILLGDFSKLLSRAEPVGQGHVFCYALRTGEGIREVTTQVSESLGAEIVSPYNVHRRWREIGKTVYPSPAGWAALVEKSAFVVTNSFHGTVLSVLLKRPFLTVGLPGAKGGLNERVRNLLGQLDLMDRFVQAGDLETTRRRLGEEIDWEAVHVRLLGMQATGRDYLSAQLSEQAGAAA
ncbi:polysaccharide pyruvyl transferase family protein [Affinirhizobium pseudoryzae]|uniref:polysaccharide pyruvyl transferase family protein n=1 Tax=Allorhizobium pseudoryzae TaxID=379684 RepID=UPI0013EDAD53|nr:polysaccharide pyruvyl transferase family protein [Allorhizobium pseudoryzae]